MISAILRLIRPTHWVKNTLVFAPLVFSGAYISTSAWLHAILAFIGFSFVASGIYALNDVFDAEYDRKHPVKKDRPVASGAISVSAASFISGLLIVIGIKISWDLNPDAALFVTGYAVVMVFYSWFLKHVMLLDVLIIAAGLTTRALYGAAAIEVEISHWLVICAFLISLMLALVKRRQELVRISEQPENVRRSLRGAPPIVAWDQWINSVAGITILAYILYTVDTRTLDHVGSNHLLYTTPFVIYGIFSYLGQVQRTNSGEDPTETLIHDRSILVAVAGWLVVVLLVLSGIL